MPAIMADHDIEGQVRALLRLLTSAAWHEVWHGLAMRVESFASLGLPENTSDAALWQFCQTQQIILITGNRNKAGTDALEAVIERSNTPTSLPVLTIGTPPRVRSAVVSMLSVWRSAYWKFSSMWSNTAGLDASIFPD
jgi:hypothetical protein